MTIIIRQNTILTTNTTYSESIQIAEGVTLTIMPGVNLDLGGNTILVAGKIQLSGTENQMAMISNGKISTLGSGSKVQGEYAKLSQIFVDRFASDGAIQFTSSIIESSSVVAHSANNSYQSVLFKNSSFEASGARNFKISESTFVDSPIKLGAWVDMMPSTQKITNTNFIGSGQVITLDPFFAGLFHPISISKSYIAGVSIDKIDSKIFDADDDIRIVTDIKPSSFTTVPYANNSRGFVVGNEIVSFEQLGVKIVNIDGTGGDDIIVGTGSHDSIQGLTGNDKISGNTGNDFIDGGVGIDTAIFLGQFSDYTLNKTTSTVTVQAIAGSDGIDTLVNVERLKFSDKSIALDINGIAGQAFRLYQAAFDRKPDLVGLGYWINDMDNGSSLTNVAAGFFQSLEFQKLYGSNPTYTTLITSFYQNVLHRAPDRAGFDYWITQLNTGKITPAGALASFCESTENQALVIGSIQNGIEYLPWLS